MNSLQQQGGRFLPNRHDHGDCMAAALEDARAVCSQRGVRLTSVRRRVLEIIWQGHRPLGGLRDSRSALGRGPLLPRRPTVYRALEFLLVQGLVHRLSSLNAFVGCCRPGHPGAGQFLLCTECGTAAELNDPGIERAIERGAAAEGFACRGPHHRNQRGLPPLPRGVTAPGRPAHTPRPHVNGGGIVYRRWSGPWGRTVSSGGFEPGAGLFLLVAVGAQVAERRV